MTSATDLSSGMDSAQQDVWLEQYVTFRLANQLFGISVSTIQDVLKPLHITPIPLSPGEIRGTINIRGSIVTSVNLRCMLGIADPEDDSHYMNVVAEHNKELYALSVDTVGDIYSLPSRQMSHCPENISKEWQMFADGVYTLKDELLIIIDSNKLLERLDNTETEDES